MVELMKDRWRLEGSARGMDSAEHPAAECLQASRRLPGEDPASPYPEDPEHWTAVYGELEGFIADVLADLHKPTPAALDHVGAECIEDAQGLRRELEHVRAHRKFWEQRRRLA